MKRVEFLSMVGTMTDIFTHY